MSDASAGKVVEIAHLGAQGDGVAATPDGPVYVPFALPGERWRLSDGTAERLTESPDRQQPLCRHFGACGGCVAQHMSPELYHTWKLSALLQAFAHRGIDIKPEPLRMVAPHSRRRAAFGVTRRGDEIVLGFRREGTHTLVDLIECPVLDSLIVQALPVLRELARLALPSGASGRLIVTRVEDGLDVAIEEGKGQLAPETSAILARRAAEAGLQRLVVFGELVYLNRAPSIRLGGVRVELPRAAFLQAVPEAEAIMTDIVLREVGKARHVADLFSGLGTFTFPIARRARVLAIDADRRAIEALETAARAASGLKPISAKVRDLMREPLSRGELEGFDAVVLDPPRAGAKAQVEMLARSTVPKIVMVSCNPATAARDARILIDGGYRIGSITPIDQFIYAPHLEIVTVLHR